MRAQSAVSGPSAGAGPMFAFFSSRLGCLGSILVSIAGTLILLFVVGLL